MAFHCLPIIFIFSLLVKQVQGWGDVGHGTVAFVAHHYLDERGEEFLNKHLPSDGKGLEYLFDVSTWADKIRRHGHPETGPWHFVDIKDDPLNNDCGISTLPKDCGTASSAGDKGCIVSAIEDMTSRAEGNHASSHDDNFDQQDAIKFLIHFIGDLHMPLHVENYAMGGNLINVTFDHHQRLNLHGIWNTDMPHKINNIKHREKHNQEVNAAIAWANRLVQNNQHRPTSTMECQDISNPQKCIMEWATESNRLNCAVVFNRGIDYLKSEDLGGEYYEGAAPIIEEQIFRAGVRLAGWINALGKTQGSHVPLAVQGGQGSGFRGLR